MYHRRTEIANLCRETLIAALVAKPCLARVSLASFVLIKGTELRE
jgi:hypothetical protein